MSQHDIEDLGLSNPSENPHFEQIIDTRFARRSFLKGGLGAMSTGLFGATALSACGGGGGSKSGADGFVPPAAKSSFKPIGASFEDKVRVPEGYSAKVFVRWGDPIGAKAGAPVFKKDATNSAVEQELQFGMHHDCMEMFPIQGADANGHFLVCVNHEYVDSGLLHGAAFDKNNPEHVAKQIAAHGVSVYEAKRVDGNWTVVTGSNYARRITGATEMSIGGPAKGHRLVQSKNDGGGLKAYGTLNNCAGGKTPWGTYLTCEENFNGFFKKAVPGAMEKRYGITNAVYGADWTQIDDRFNLDMHPNEAQKFGWVVEIDPYDAASKPVKRTALGRFKHEGATVTLAPGGQVVVYMGDDERNEYAYKFVSKGSYNAANRAANMNLLDEGTLYVAKFKSDGSGEWLPLVFGQGALVAPAFNDQAEVLVNARAAADAVGATKMDRPEWVAVHPETKDVYLTLTNNSKRGASGAPAVDAANPRASNSHGHIIHWREAGSDAAATSFTWNLFVLAGDPKSSKANLQGNIQGDIFSAPDGLAFDTAGRLWIQTDMSTSAMYHPEHAASRTDYKNFGNNQMLVADPRTGEIKRFLTGPVGCELTGWMMTPDRKTLFVNIQHPGEPLAGAEDNDPANPMKFSSWPDGPSGGRPRSATVVITRDDGGEVGA
ncbi:MAG: PhoX family phosphatase [Gammaproteobacteria bacterium]|nr:PhoX family phosphatase [Gammaproteobacteria bacterium]